MKKSLIISAFLASAMPMFAFAQQLRETGNFFTRVLEIIRGTLIPLVFAIALLYFFWGVAKYIWSASPGNKEEAKTIMIWGVVALFVMTSIWGLVRLLQGEFNINPSSTIEIPTIGGSRSGTGGGGAGGSGSINGGAGFDGTE